MRLDTYKFKIRRDRNNGVGYDITEVYPHFKSLKKKWALENGQRFFREALDGKLVLYGQNFELIYNASFETKFTLIIERKNKEGKMEEFFRGTFSKTDCKFNVSDRSCEPTISPIDSYTKIMENYESTYDLLKVPPAITSVNLYKRPCIQVYITGGSTISNFVGGTYWEQDTNFVVDSVLDLRDKYFFTYKASITELKVTGAASGISGTYTGAFKEGDTGKFVNESGHYIQYRKDGNFGYYFLCKPDGTDLYKSEAVIEYRGSEMAALFGHSSYYYIGDTFRFSAVPGFTGGVILPSMVMAKHAYQRLLCDVDSITDSDGVKTTYDIPLDDIVPNNSNYRKVIGLADANSIILSTSKTVAEPTRYGINDEGQYFTSAFIPGSTGLGRPLPLCRSTWSNASIWYIYASNYEALETKARKEYKLKDAYKLSDVIKALLSKIAPDIKHEATEEYSKFLYGANNPIVLDSFTLFMAPKSNVLKGEYDQAAQKAEVTFKDIMDMLQKCFRCYWHIEDNKLKIEHVSWYNNGRAYSGQPYIQYDLTQITDPRNNKPIGYKQMSLEFDKTELASRYEFGWMDTVTDAFKGTNVDVKSEYIDKSLKEDVTIQNFTTDIDYMLLSPSDFSMDGFALIAAKLTDGAYKVPFVELDLISSEDNKSYTLNLQNGHLSWFYLLQFYMFDMPARILGYEELEALIVRDVKACIEQQVRFPVVEDIFPDLYSLLKTELFEGYITELSMDLISKQADATVNSKP